LDDAVQRIASSLLPGANIEIRKDLAGLPRLLAVTT
jgi:hypothetical protein